MINLFTPFRSLRLRSSLSERQIVGAISISRGAIRSAEAADGNNFTIGTVGRLATFFDRDLEVVVTAKDTDPDCSTVATAYKIHRDGFDSWKIHIFDLADEFRRTLDARLINMNPPAFLDPRLLALLCSTVSVLCDEVRITAPSWAKQRHFLPTPWFVSGINSLKAMAILESPLPFRANNIFVLSNFLSRV